MDEVLIKIKPLIEDFKMPLQATTGAAGFDCYYQGQEEVSIKAGHRALVPLGFSIEVPEGFEAQVRPRSGLAKKNGITVLNSPGTIDSDYRGPVGAIIANLHEESDYIIKPGERVCQIVIAPVPKVLLKQVNELSDTERGSGGFGSTGK